MKVVFMGTPDFAVASLKQIIQSKHQVAAVVTATDKAAGRGKKITQSAVKQFAVQHQIKVLQPNNLKNADFIESLQSLNADVFVVVAFRMLPKVVWQIPPKGTFNLHASLLPNYRGAAPINWAIINNEKQTGVTTFLIDEQIDTGNLLLQKSTPINPTETAGSLHDKLMQLGAELLIETLNLLEDDKIKPKPQTTPNTIQHAPKITKEDCKINWHQTPQQIDCFVRGFSPYPAAWTYLNTNNQTKTLKIYSGTTEPCEHQYPIGTLVMDKKTAKIAINKGFYLLTEVQLEGKKRMSVLDFVNGLDKQADYVVV